MSSLIKTYLTIGVSVPITYSLQIILCLSPLNYYRWPGIQRMGDLFEETWCYIHQIVWGTHSKSCEWDCAEELFRINPFRSITMSPSSLFWENSKNSSSNVYINSLFDNQDFGWVYHLISGPVITFIIRLITSKVEPNIGTFLCDIGCSRI